MKKVVIILILIVLVSLVFIRFEGCKDEYYMKKDLELICKYPRGADNKEKEEARNLIISSFENSGLNVEQQEFTCYDGKYKGVNIIATIPPKSLTENERVLIIGTHYDTDNNIVGANDNAAGVAVLLNIARNITKYEFDFEIKLVAFDCEELGCIGSNYFCISLGQDIKNVIGMINFDNFASKNAENVNIYIGDFEENNLFNILKENNDIKPSKFMGISDYKWFLENNIPILFFGHPIIEEERHNENDRIENINMKALVYVFQSVMEVVRNIN